TRLDGRQWAHPSISGSSVGLTHRLRAGQCERRQQLWGRAAAEAIVRRLWSTWCRYAYGSIPLTRSTSSTYSLFRGYHQPGLHRWGCHPRRSYHRVEQVLKHGGWVLATAGVHRRYLDDGAARCNEPVEALPL